LIDGSSNRVIKICCGDIIKEVHKFITVFLM